MPGPPPFLAAQFDIDRIPRSVDQYAVRRAFADVLHSADFQYSARRTNFAVVLAPSKMGALHAGYGVLLVPDEKLGRDFGRWIRNPSNAIRVGEGHERKKLWIRWSDILLPKFGNVARQAALFPFVEPEKELARKTLIDRLKREDQRFGVSTVDFGMLFYDDKTKKKTFSVETSISGSVAIVFPFGERRLRAPTELRIILDVGGMNDTFDTIVLPFHTIAHMEVGKKDTKHAAQSFILFELLRPPIFQQEDTHAGEDRKSKRRLAILSEDHGRVAPYAHHLRIRLRDNYSHFVDFYSSVLERNEPRIVPRVTPLADATLTPSITEALETWLHSLDWIVAFQVEMLLCESLVTAKQALGSLQQPIEELRKTRDARAVSKLLKSYAVTLNMVSMGKETVAQCFQRMVRELDEKTLELGLLNSDIESFSAHHVTLTPTRKRMEGPYPTDSNRVIRNFPDHWDYFVRVDFRDEDLLAYRLGWEVDGEPFLQDCVGMVLRNGFTLAGRELQFLGYSTSSLREHSVWFMHPFTNSDGHKITADSIRSSLGDFTHLLRKPARYAARLGQAFTATIPSIEVLDHEFTEIEDLGMHTDGCGVISRACANEIWATICSNNPDRFGREIQPSSYQIRFKGYKGMVAVDEDLEDHKMLLRPSMRKFVGSGNVLEIARYFNSPMKAFMNRPLITVLEHRGVTIEALSAVQQSAVQKVHLADRDVELSRRLIADYGTGRAFGLPNIMKQIGRLMVPPNAPKNIQRPVPDEFIKRLIRITQYHALLDIKNHARIWLERGWLLPGVADEGPAYEARGMTDVHKLGLGEVYACVQHSLDEEPQWLKGRCIIWRNPVIHPGDLAQVRGIGQPPKNLKSFCAGKKNVLILPSIGSRSLASQLAGGDVDGDLFYICQENTLFPPIYEAPAPPDDADPARKDKEIPEETPVGFNDVCDFVVDYIDSNNVGLIADKHILRADQCRDGPSDYGCMDLAKLYSRAVDFPKTGTKVEVPILKSLPIPYKPDWHAIGDEKENPDLYYRSDRALGILYRNIDTPKLDLDTRQYQSAPKFSDTLLGMVGELVKQSLLLSAEADKQEDVSWIPPIFKAYQTELRYICMTHAVIPTSTNVLREEEVVLGLVLDVRDKRLRKDRSQRVKTHVATLVRNIKRALSVVNNGEYNDEEVLEETLRGAYAAWRLAVERANGQGDADSVFGAPSFSMIALGMVFDTSENLRRLRTRISE